MKKEKHTLGSTAFEKTIAGTDVQKKVGKAVKELKRWTVSPRLDSIKPWIIREKETKRNSTLL